MSKRRKFSEEFKREAVGLTRQLGTMVSQIAGNIGVGAGLLGRWPGVATYWDHDGSSRASWWKYCSSASASKACVVSPPSARADLLVEELMLR